MKVNFDVRRLLLLFLVSLLIVSCSKKKTVDVPDLPADKEIIVFVFNTESNPSLPQTINCEIKGDTIYAVAFAGTDITNLKAGFATTGTKVTVNNQQQVTEQTVHDFSSPVTYTVEAENGSKKNYVVKFTDTKLPVVYISTNNIPVDSKEVYIPGHLSIKSNLSGDSLYGGDMEIRGRGNSTWYMPKKPYKIKLNKKTGLLGMNQSKQWVLLANYADKSLMRNEVGFELSRRLGLAYTVAGRFVDVILNGTYVGNYELVEQIDVASTKVNVKEQPDGATALPDISGGYLTEIDGFYLSETVYFITTRGMPVTVHYPDDDVINDAQKEYITHHYNMLEDSLFGPDFSDPVSGYRKYFDVESYINCYLVNEIIGNPDAFWSTYMYKDYNNDRLFTGPVWDLDIAANNDIRIGDAENKMMLDSAYEPRLWINRLMQDQSFRNAIRDRWNSIKDKVNSIPSFVDQLAAQLAYSQKKNFEAWNILNEQVYLNLQAAGSYEGEVEYLKNYLVRRLAWLDTQFNSGRFD